MKIVQLAPLSAVQRKLLAGSAGLEHTASFVEAIEREGLGSLAGRPGDLLDLAAYWSAEGRFASLAAMTAHVVTRKLAERDGHRPDNRELSPVTALEGAQRLAAALTLGKTFTLRAGPGESDPRHAGSLDPASILPEMADARRNALLRRGVFAPSTYGRVRFHHRGTQEFLAAGWLLNLRRAGCPLEAIEEVIFRDLHGVRTVVPSLAATAAWLAHSIPEIRDGIIDREPLVLLRHGDPRSLPLDVKKRLLIVYAERHAQGSIANDRLDDRATQMFAHPDLAATIRRSWELNTRAEFRVFLLRLVRDGAIAACIELARVVAFDRGIGIALRLAGIEALEACGSDADLSALALGLGDEPPAGELLAPLSLLLFPRLLSVKRLLDVIERVVEPGRAAARGFKYVLRELWEVCPVDQRSVFAYGLARICLTPPFVDRHRRISAAHSKLASALQPVAADLLSDDVADPPPAGLVALLMAIERAERSASAAFGDRLASDISALLDRHSHLKRALFWADAEEIVANGGSIFHVQYLLSHGANGPLCRLNADDLSWLCQDVRLRPTEEERRAALFQVVRMLKASPDRSAVAEGLADLRALIGEGGAQLQCDLDAYVSPPTGPDMEAALNTERLYMREQADSENATATSLLGLRDEVCADPASLRDAPGSIPPDRLSRLGRLTDWLEEATGEPADIAATRWRLLEAPFSQPVADAYRDGMRALWRRAEAAGGTAASKAFATLAFAGLNVDAQDAGWAEALTPSDARRAAGFVRHVRYGFPFWVEDLAARHPSTAMPAIEALARSEWSSGNQRGGVIYRYASLAGRVPDAIAATLTAVIMSSAPGSIEILREAVRLARRLDVEGPDRERFVRLLRRRLDAAKAAGRDAWARGHLAFLFQFDADVAVERLLSWIEEREVAEPAFGRSSEAGPGPRPAADATFAELTFGSLFAHHDTWCCVAALAGANADSLARLVRSVYRHVRPSHDRPHDGVFHPDARDPAEEARNAVFGQLADRSDSDAYLAMRSLAADVEGRAVRFAELAQAMVERGAEAPPWTPQEILAFEAGHVSPAKTGSEMLRVVEAVLGEIARDIASADASSRAVLSRAVDEREVQAWLTEQLRLRARGRFHVHREAEVVHGDKPDIVVSSSSAGVEVAIEVKHGNMDWPVRRLETALTRQLAEAYLKPQTRRQGVLFVSLHRARIWRDPQTKAPIDFAGLIVRLDALARTIVRNAQGAIEVRAVGLDASS